MHEKLKKNVFILSIGLIIGLMFFALLSGSLTVYKAADALFILGMLMIMPGLISLIRRLGMGELFAFSWGRMHHVLHKEKHGESGRYPASYFEYLNREKQNTRKSSFPFWLGLIFVVISYILSFAAESIL